MKKTLITSLLATVLLSTVPPGEAQQPAKVPRIGFQLDSPASAVTARTEAFRQGLRELGYIEGKNIIIEWRSAEGKIERRSELAAELVRLKVDLIVSGGPSVTRGVKEATSTIPIVMAQDTDPVGSGFVASLARPGGNITGFTTFEYPVGGKWLELLNDAAPGRSRVAVLHDPDNPSQVAYLQGLEAAAPTFGVQLTRADVRNAADIERAINDFAQQPNGALVVAPTAVTILHRDLIIALAAQHRLPAVYPYRFFAGSGGLMSYGIDLADQYRRAASYVDLILKGAKPGDLPVQLSAKFELVVNLKTAKALGLTIPESFLLRADEVIE